MSGEKGPRKTKKEKQFPWVVKAPIGTVIAFCTAMILHQCIQDAKQTRPYQLVERKSEGNETSGDMNLVTKATAELASAPARRRAVRTFRVSAIETPAPLAPISEFPSYELAKLEFDLAETFGRDFPATSEGQEILENFQQNLAS